MSEAIQLSILRPPPGCLSLRAVDWRNQRRRRHSPPPGAPMEIIAIKYDHRSDWKVCKVENAAAIQRSGGPIPERGERYIGTAKDLSEVRRLAEQEVSKNGA